jgi:hypothetical protein
MNDNELIWEAYQTSIQEGWGKNLAMMGMGALLAHGALKHNTNKPETKSTPQHSQVDIKNKANPIAKKGIEKLEYRKELAKTLKRSNWEEKYYIPIDNNGKPLLDLKTLNKIRQKHNQILVTDDAFIAVQKTIRK